MASASLKIPAQKAVMELKIYCLKSRALLSRSVSQNAGQRGRTGGEKNQDKWKNTLLSTGWASGYTSLEHTEYPAVRGQAYRSHRSHT